VPGNRKTKKKWFWFSGISFVSLVLTYWFLVHFSALYLVRWFLKETGIPIEIQSASWNFKVKEILNGKIQNLKLQVFYQPLDLSIKIDSPVQFRRRSERWGVELEPKIFIKNFPPTSGKVFINLEVHKNIPKSARVDFDLHEIDPFEFQFLNVKSWNLNGHFQWNPFEEDPEKQWYSNLNLDLNNLEVFKEVFIEKVSLKSQMKWSKGFPFPVEADLHFIAQSIQLLKQDMFIEEPKAEGNLSLQFDGKNFKNIFFALKKPFFTQVRAKGDVNALVGTWSVAFILEDWVDKKLTHWFESKFPIIRRAKAKGDLKLSGVFKFEQLKNIDLQGKLDFNAKNLSLPKKEIFIEDLKWSTPISYPHLPDWGSLSIGKVGFQSFVFQKIKMDTQLSQDGINITTEDSSGKDQPLVQQLFGNSFQVSELYAALTPKEKLQFSMTAKGGPFKLSQIQKELCILPGSLLEGSLEFSYPQMVQLSELSQDGKATKYKETVHFIGKSKLNIFNGQVEVGDLKIFLGDGNPVIEFDMHWQDLDLQNIGSWSHFGDMRGNLNGSLKNARLVFSDLGPTMPSYDFTVQGSKREGRPIRFFGRAVNSIMELMGSRKSEMPWYAQTALHYSIIFRNLFPATADYFGFHAQTKGEWTEVTTFDPPSTKNHYILYGTAFTIPLNTHGVYPALLKTNDFQEWLKGMLEYFKGRIANESEDNKSKSSCIPFWEK